MKENEQIVKWYQAKGFKETWGENYEDFKQNFGSLDSNEKNTFITARNLWYSKWPKDFRERLDQMILNGYDNDEIYEVCLNEYGLTKEEIKANLQVRRRRLGVTLKEHYENDPGFVAKVDKLLKKGYSNDEIIDKLGMSREGRASARLLQYRRSILKIPAAVSKYFDNEQSKEVYELFDRGYTNEEIIEYFHYSALPYNEIIKIKKTLNSRRCQYKKKKLQEI
jgi:cytochrome c-type biogenesis protein CcmH/NrfF